MSWGASLHAGRFLGSFSEYEIASWPSTLPGKANLKVFEAANACVYRTVVTKKASHAMAKMCGNAALSKYADELVATAKNITAPGRGILAADESTGTIGKRASAPRSSL